MSSALLTIQNLFLSYEDKLIIQDVSYSFHKGKVYALCGANGCGKSTLLSALIGTLKPLKGGITLAGKPLSSYSDKQRARHISLLCQRHESAVDLTVSELVACGRYCHDEPEDDPHRKAMIQQALHQLHLEGLEDYPVGQLSGGQQQRAWIAMAIAQEAKILLLDEPTTYLDIRHQVEVLQQVRELAHRYGITIIWVLHDINQASAFSDEILFLKHGKIAYSGSPNEVMQENILLDIFGVAMPRLTDTQPPICLPLYG